MIIFTSICANYLHKARTLAKSVKENINDATFMVALTEKSVPSSASCPYFDKVILSKDIWEGESFESFIFPHAIVEASTAVKGRFFQYLMDKFPDENMFVYLDPDCYVYSDFIELRNELEHAPIILCPHLLQPGNIEMEISSLAHGVYNLGFLAVIRSDEARRFIDWWTTRLNDFCYDDIPKGIFTDQRWIDLAPCFFEVMILKHKGYDFATWSIKDSGLLCKNRKYYVKQDELRFVHFSGYGKTIENCMNQWLPQNEQVFHGLYNDYKIMHELNDQDHVSQSTWDYGCFCSGEKITDENRIYYRDCLRKTSNVQNPFEKSNAFFDSMRRLSFTQNNQNFLGRGIRLFLKFAEKLGKKK